MAGRWMTYCHDALGLGHIRRSMAIVRSVMTARPDLAALLVTCSPMADALLTQPGLDYIKLPSARKVKNQVYAPRSLPMATRRFSALRASLIRDVMEHFDPDVLLVDKSPIGLMGELKSTLERTRERRRPGRLILGIRDILDEPETVAREWSPRLLRLIERHYDEIWIYGDRELFDAPHAYRWPESLTRKVRYTGYLVPPSTLVTREVVRARFCANGEPLAVVTVGGGEDGARTIATYLDAARHGLLPAHLTSVVVLGPCMPREEQAQLAAMAPPEVHVETFIPDLNSVMAHADVVVGMAGYNTVCELMAGGPSAVLVPRTRPRREQLLRARAFASRGLAEVIEPEALEPSSLAKAVTSALQHGRRPGMHQAEGGLARVASEMSRLLPATAAA